MNYWSTDHLKHWITLRNNNSTAISTNNSVRWNCLFQMQKQLTTVIEYTVTLWGQDTTFEAQDMRQCLWGKHRYASGFKWRSKCHSKARCEGPLSLYLTTTISKITKGPWLRCSYLKYPKTTFPNQILTSKRVSNITENFPGEVKMVYNLHEWNKLKHAVN